jgi:hypothetical protein
MRSRHLGVDGAQGWEEGLFDSLLSSPELVLKIISWTELVLEILFGVGARWEAGASAEKQVASAAWRARRSSSSWVMVLAGADKGCASRMHVRSGGWLGGRLSGTKLRNVSTASSAVPSDFTAQVYYECTWTQLHYKCTWTQMYFEVTLQRKCT